MLFILQLLSEHWLRQTAVTQKFQNTLWFCQNKASVIMCLPNDCSMSGNTDKYFFAYHSKRCLNIFEKLDFRILDLFVCVNCLNRQNQSKVSSSSSLSWVCFVSRNKLNKGFAFCLFVTSWVGRTSWKLKLVNNGDFSHIDFIRRNFPVINIAVWCHTAKCCFKQEFVKAYCVHIFLFVISV